MKPSKSDRCVSGRAMGILSLVALLMGCTVQSTVPGDAGPQGPVGPTGPTGATGAPGVPCAGCVTSASIAPGAVGKLQIADGGVTAPALAVGAVTAPAIAPGAVTSAAIGDNAVRSTAIVPGAVGPTQIAAGGVASANIAAGAVGSAQIASSSVTGANIDPATTITASGFAFTAPVAGSYFANPAECQRGLSPAAPYQDMQVVHPPANPYGPSIVISNLAAGVYEMLCPVNLQAPPGATLTITGATLLFFDGSTNCLVAAQLRTKVLGANDVGTIIATQYDGANSTDFAFTVPLPASKPFPAFTPFTVTSSTLFWVNAFIQLQAAAAFAETNCRYSGVTVTYTLDRP